VEFRAASDQAMLVYLGEEIGLESHRRVFQLLRLLQEEPLAWVRNLQPAYSSLLVRLIHVQSIIRKSKLPCDATKRARKK